MYVLSAAVNKVLEVFDASVCNIIIQQHQNIRQ